ncbi:DnaB-like helicase N-terminal domain-containing protein [Embleya sp. NPDC005971]|uniref:DnaB-like helicase N-terminal domain-containing protein n=1 Tax=Embleya sp. NPDC005971 TaxID=3156724 RepID=UPI00340EF340
MEPQTPEIRAERAVLGAALLAPHQVERLTPWVTPGCFRQQHHADVWRAMTRIGGTGHRDRYPDVVLNALREAGYPEHTHGGPRLHSYMQACPRPGHAPLYGGMVVEAAMHRAMTYHGRHLQQVAASARPATVELDMREVEATAGRVAGLAPAWQAVPAPVRDRLDPADATRPIAWPDTPQLTRTHADPEAERAFLSGVLADPTAAREYAWIRPADFGRPEHAAAWTAIGELTRADVPIDPITVAWQLTRHGPVAAPLASEDLLAWAREGTRPGAHLGAVAVATGAALDRVDLAGRRLETLGLADAVPPSRLLAEATCSIGPAARDVEHLAEHLTIREIAPHPDTPALLAPARREIQAPPWSVRDGPEHPAPEHDIDDDIDI